MKAIIINSCIKYGSTGHITYSLYKYLSEKGNDVRMFYGRGEVYKDEPDLIRMGSKFSLYTHGLLTRITGYQGCYSKSATNKLINYIDEFNPDVVILGNLHGYYISEFMFLRAMKKRNQLCIYYMFDEYPYLGKCAYSGECDKYKKICENCPQVRNYPKSIIFDRSKEIFNLKNEIYKNYNRLFFVSIPYNVMKSKEAALFKYNNMEIYDIGWGIDAKNIYYPQEFGELRKKHNIPKDNTIVLAVAPLNDERKGMKKYYIECAKRLISEDITFIHIGFNGDKSICPPNYVPIEYVNDQGLLAQYFSLADSFVITSISDTYPTVSLISMSCGTPVIGFNTSGIPYTVPEPYGTYVTTGDLVELIEEIKKVKRKDSITSKSCREYALKNYDQSSIFDKLIDLIHTKL